MTDNTLTADSTLADSGAPAETTTPTQTTTPLSTAIREATDQAHRETEHSSFMHDLMSGASDRDAHLALSAQLFHVYRALEDAVARNSSDPVLAPLVDSRLNRTEALAADLSDLLGEPWDSQIPALPATTAYVNRIEQANPAQLVAHHYTRYLGDLSGGQIIATMLKRHYDLDKPRFYDFSIIGKPKPYKDSYRAALDGLPVDDTQRRQLLDEAVTAFGLNGALFDQLHQARG